MANYTEATSSKLDWAMPFQRTGAFPIDRTTLFDSYADAVKYAKGDTSDPDKRGLCGSSYIGQSITVYENDAVNNYTIQPDRTLAAQAVVNNVISNTPITEETAEEGVMYYEEII